MHRHTLLACLALASVPAIVAGAQVSAPARAQPVGQMGDHPPFMPTRDVSVVYDVQPDGAPQAQRITVSFSGDGRLMRIDSPDGQGATILDRDRKLMTIVVNPARVYMEVPERQELRSPFLLDGSMKFTRAGSDTIAGVACTRWTITAQSGNAAACVTGDGVVLGEAGVDSEGAHGHLTAQRVSYGPVAASQFQPPPGYSRVAHPEGPAPFARQQDGQPAQPMTSPAQPMTSPAQPMPQ